MLDHKLIIHRDNIKGNLKSHGSKKETFIQVKPVYTWDQKSC
jgi:hypothetical protein